MSNNRRNFLKLGFLGGIGISSAFTNRKENSINFFHHLEGKPQKFNMRGYRVPKIDTVKIAFIGLGMRSLGAVYRMKNIANVEIKALCDIRKERAEKVKSEVEKIIRINPKYTEVRVILGKK